MALSSDICAAPPTAAHTYLGTSVFSAALAARVAVAGTIHDCRDQRKLAHANLGHGHARSRPKRQPGGLRRQRLYHHIRHQLTHNAPRLFAVCTVALAAGQSGAGCRSLFSAGEHHRGKLEFAARGKLERGDVRFDRSDNCCGRVPLPRTQVITTEGNPSGYNA